MNWWLIALGVVLLLFPVRVVLVCLGWLVFQAFANNWVDKMFWPLVAILATTGTWALGMGIGWW